MNEINSMNIKLPALRQAYQLSKSTLSELTGISRRTISRIEGNYDTPRYVPKYKTLRKLASTFSLRTDYMLCHTKQEVVNQSQLMI